jgi:CheY-like chemotaxis protein
MDGYEATREIRILEEDKNINALPIIALTANTSKDDRILCHQAGMNDMVTKPFRRADITDCVRKWLPPQRFVDKLDNLDLDVNIKAV